MDIMTQAVAQREEALRDETRIVDTLYALSGASREACAQFPMPRNTAVFGPTFRGEGSYLAAPVISRSGQVIGALFFGHDQPDVFSERARRSARGIAAQAAAAIDNAQLYKAAQDAIRLRDDFLSIASHELRTPLAAIKGTAQAALRAHARETLDDDRLGRSLTTIARATDHVARLASDLLDVARLRAGKMPLRHETVDLGVLLEGLAAGFRDQWEGERELVLELHVQDAVVTGDPDRLEQVFANLVDNAAKYSAEGSPVHLSIGSDGAGLRVSVADTGIGVSDGAQAALFQPFGRAPERDQLRVTTDA